MNSTASWQPREQNRRPCRSRSNAYWRQTRYCKTRTRRWATHKETLESDAARFLAVSGLTVAAAAAVQPKQEHDDLTIVEGIGPKIEELLNQHDIYTFAQLADTEVADLETIIRSAGSRFQTADPETWPRQARLAANRDLDTSRRP